MKNLLILVLVGLCLNGSLQAQENVLEKRVTFNYQEATLESILKDLDHRYGVKFSYVNNLVPLSQKINAQVNDQPLKNGLEAILAATDIDYQLVNGQVVLRKNQLKKPVEKPKASQAESSVPPVIQQEEKSSPSNGKEEASIKEEITYEPLQLEDSIIIEEPVSAENSEGNMEGEDNSSTLTGWEKVKNFFRKKPVLKNEDQSSEDLSLDENSADSEVQEIPEEYTEEPEYEVKPLHIGLIYPLSNHFTDAGKYVNQLSFHGLVGLSKGVDGVEASGFGNITTDFVRGVQLSGFFNVTGESVEGVQAAGFVNVTGGPVKGAQFAGFLNIGDSSAESGSFAGFGNIRAGAVTGGQFAGFINTAESVKGIQAAGFINTTAKDVEGVQVSGFINRARLVKGVQIGIVNFADSVDGVSIGIFNFVRRGYRRVEVFGSESWHGNLAFKFGVQHFYTILAAGVQFQENNNYTWGYGFGFGSQLDLSNRWKVSLDATTYQVKEEGTWRINYLNLHNNLRIGFDRQFAKHFTLFMGPSFNVMVSRKYNPETRQFGSDFPPYHVFNRTTSTTNVTMWPGFFIGIRI